MAISEKNDTRKLTEEEGGIKQRKAAKTEPHHLDEVVDEYQSYLVIGKRKHC